MAPLQSNPVTTVLDTDVQKSRTLSPALRLRKPAEVHEEEIMDKYHVQKENNKLQGETARLEQEILGKESPSMQLQGEKAVKSDHNGLNKMFENLVKVKHFWFGPRFQLHRIMGLSYLIQYAWAIYLYIADYPAFLSSYVIITLPICGFLQAVIASCTFTFLPRKKEAGYVAFGDVGALSYNYVLENTFFSMLLMFQFLYYDDRLFKPFFRKTHVFELLFVFLPYMPFIRYRWPVSSFRDTVAAERRVKEENKDWFNNSILVTKVFYIFAKHYMGFFSNYMRYMDRIGPDEMRVNHGLLLGGCWGTTIAMFIHTLRFKGYISAKMGGLIYQISFPWMSFYFFRLALMLSSHLDTFVITTIGMLLNNSVMTTRKRPLWHIYQILVMIGMTRGVLHNLW